MMSSPLVVLAATALLLAMLWAFQRRLIYIPGAWFVLPTGPKRDVAVLVAAGNAGNRSLRAPLAAALARQVLAVLLFDYRGYGGNRGRPTESGLARDSRAALAIPYRRGRPAARPAALLRREPRLGRGDRTRG